LVTYPKRKTQMKNAEEQDAEESILSSGEANK
jgi:hypothetical protein